MSQQIKNLPAMQETQEMRVRSLGQEDPLEKEMATHSIFLPGKFHGQRSLVHGVAKSWITMSTNTIHSKENTVMRETG